MPGGDALEPLPETREALAEFDTLEDPDPEELLSHLEAAVRRLVPSLVGVSISLVRDRLTFTWVASTADVAVLDATQYLTSGPCVDVSRGREDVAHVFPTNDPLDEERWRLFAQSTAAQGVASTLSLPLYSDGRLAGGVNLYASTSKAFADRIDQVAALVGAMPSEGVTDADLSFATRREAAAAPERVRDRNIVETAVGLIAGDKGIDLVSARNELLDAAAQAGVHEAQVARVVVKVFTQRGR